MSANTLRACQRVTIDEFDDGADQAALKKAATAAADTVQLTTRERHTHRGREHRQAHILAQTDRRIDLHCTLVADCLLGIHPHREHSTAGLPGCRLLNC